MKIGFLRHPTTVVEKRWVEYLASKGHEVHLLYFEGDFNACQEVWCDFPDLVQLANVYIHCINYNFFLSWLIKSIKNKVIRRREGQSASLSGSTGSGKTGTVSIWQTTISLIYKLLLEPLYTIAKVKSLRSTINEINPDILHAHSVDYYGFFGAKSRFQPFILSAWGSDVMVTPKSSKVNSLRVKFALRNAYVITTTSESLKKYIIKEFGIPEDKVRAIPWGIDLGIFRRGYETEGRKLRVELSIDANNFVIMSPRYIRELYRTESIVRAMPHVIVKHPNAVLILLRGLAEGNEYESYLDSLANELGVAQNIKVIKRELNSHEMAVLYNACDALISIPISDGGFAFCIQEGMICGVIPIVGDLEVYHQYLSDGENAFFVNGEDPRQIAEKIVYCIEHPELKQKFFEINSRIIEEKEDWHNNAPKMEELYNELLAQRASNLKAR